MNGVLEFHISRKVERISNCILNEMLSIIQITTEKIFLDVNWIANSRGNWIVVYG